MGFGIWGGFLGFSGFIIIIMTKKCSFTCSFIRSFIALIKDASERTHFKDICISPERWVKKYINGAKGTLTLMHKRMTDINERMKLK